MDDDAKALDGSRIAAEIRTEVALEVGVLRGMGVTPRLDAIIVGEDPASKLYVGSKAKTLGDLGMVSRTHVLAADTTRTAIEDLVDRLNADPEVGRNPRSASVAGVHQSGLDPESHRSGQGRRWLSPGERRPTAAGETAVRAVHARRRHGDAATRLYRNRGSTGGGRRALRHCRQANGHAPPPRTRHGHDVPLSNP